MANDDIKNLTIIEIGNDTTKMLAGSFSGHTPYVFCVKEVSTKNVLLNGAVRGDCVKAVGDALKEVVNIHDEAITNKCSLDHALFILPPDGMKVYEEHQRMGVLGRSNNEGKVDVDDVRGLLKSIETNIRQSAPDYQIIDIIPGVYRYGGKTSNTAPYGEKADSIETRAWVHCVTRDSFATFQNVIKSTSLNPGEYSYGVAPYAASKLIALQKGDIEAYIILDLGGYSSDVSLIGEGNLYQSMTMPQGMNHLTQKIADSFDISFKEAENIKRTFGYNLRKTVFNAPIIVNKHGQPYYQANLNKVIEDWFKEYDIVLKNAINTLLEPTIAKNSAEAANIFKTCPIFLIGGGANLNDIEDLLKDGLDQHIPEVFVPNVAGARDPKYVNLLGLLVHKCTSDNPLEENNGVTLSRVKHEGE